MIIHIMVAQNMVLRQDKAVGISSFCQLAETLNMQAFDLKGKTEKTCNMTIYSEGQFYRPRTNLMLRSK